MVSPPKWKPTNTYQLNWFSKKKKKKTNLSVEKIVMKIVYGCSFILRNEVIIKYSQNMITWYSFHLHLSWISLLEEKCYVKNIFIILLQQIVSGKLVLDIIDGYKSNFNGGFKL